MNKTSFVTTMQTIRCLKERLNVYLPHILELTNEKHPAVLAYNAAVEMLERLDGFNEYLQRVYNEVFQIGVGIHYGSVVVGDLGHPKHNSFTAIGDTVNIAARIRRSKQGSEYHSRARRGRMRVRALRRSYGIQTSEFQLRD